MAGRITFAAILLAGVFGSGLDQAVAGPGPGDVYREYKWRPQGKWQRVTGPDAAADGAKQFLPNAVNTIRIDDLQQAVKVEACLEMLLCHSGTVDKRMRLNGNAWLPIPESKRIPGQTGRGPPASEYQSMRYPSVDVPLEHVRQGQNTFELTCRRGTSLGAWWPQWILYGVTFRVYYREGKPHPAGRIVAPRAGGIVGDMPVFQAEARGPRPIRQVDFVGWYEDFNWEGDGDYRQWHWRYLYGQIQNHMGTATGPPYRVTWHNRWIPDQDRPLEVMVRIVDDRQMCYLTPSVEGLRLVRSRSVKMYKPYDVPKGWSTRAGNTHRCKVDVPDEPGRAIAARVFMTTWNGVAGHEIGINGTKVIDKIGKDHDLSYDSFPVPLDLIRRGTNTLYTASGTEHHGIEVQWPGMVLMIMYEGAAGSDERPAEEPPRRGASTPYGPGRRHLVRVRAGPGNGSTARRAIDHHHGRARWKTPGPTAIGASSGRVGLTTLWPYRTPDRDEPPARTPVAAIRTWR